MDRGACGAIVHGVMTEETACTSRVMGLGNASAGA